MRRISIVLLIMILFLISCSDEEGTGTKDVLSDVSYDDIGSKSEDYAFIVNASTDYKSGTFSVMKVSDKSVTKDKGVIHSDAVAKAFNGLIFVINRYGQDNITVIDPKKDFSVVKQFSVGASTNPQDIAIYKEKMFVTKLASNILDIYSTADFSKVGFIDVSKYADADGYAEPQNILVYKDKLYLTVLRLDKDKFYAPTDKSLLLVIDPVDLKVEKEVQLGATNPMAGMVLDESNDRFIIAESGVIGANDGRIEFYSVSSGIITQQIITEEALGGDLINIAYSKNKIFTVVSDASFNTILKAYDLGSAQLKTVFETQGFSIAGISIFNDTDLYLCDRDKNKPGLRIFGVDSLSQKTTEPIDTGLPPVSLVFFKM